MAEYIALSMTRLGVRVNVVTLGFDPIGLSPEFLRLLARSQPDASDPVLLHCWPRPDMEQFLTAKNLFIYTMYESSGLPAGWADVFNRARALISPTRHWVSVCRSSGVTVPIDVVPLGIDPDVYWCQAHPRTELITTLMVGPIDDRKHVLTGVAAWKKAFHDRPEARLIIKTQYGLHNYTPDDPRILYVDRIEGTRGIAHWYRKADLLMALGNEGFGLPMVEAIACGVPVIALDSEGQSDMCGEAAGCLLTVKPREWRPFVNPAFGPAGDRGIPHVDDVVANLLWADEHYAEVLEMARRGAAWAAQHRNIWTIGSHLLDVIRRHADLSSRA